MKKIAKNCARRRAVQPSPGLCRALPGESNRGKFKAAAEAAAAKRGEVLLSIGDVGLLWRPPSRPPALCVNLFPPGRARREAGPRAFARGGPGSPRGDYSRCLEDV